MTNYIIKNHLITVDHIHQINNNAAKDWLYIDQDPNLSSFALQALQEIISNIDEDETSTTINCKPKYQDNITEGLDELKSLAWITDFKITSIDDKNINKTLVINLDVSIQTAAKEKIVSEYNTYREKKTNREARKALRENMSKNNNKQTNYANKVKKELPQWFEAIKTIHNPNAEAINISQATAYIVQEGPRLTYMIEHSTNETANIGRYRTEGHISETLIEEENDMAEQDNDNPTLEELQKLQNY